MKKIFQISFIIMISLMGIAFAVNETTSETIPTNISMDGVININGTLVSIDAVKIKDDMYSVQTVYNLTDNLIAYYPFDENASDITGNNNDGTLSGSILTNGIVGDGAYEFDGVDDYVTLPDYTHWTDITSDFTISMWVKLNNLNSASGGQTLIDLDSSGSSILDRNSGIAIAVSNDGTISFYCGEGAYNSGNDLRTIKTSPGSLSANTSSLITVTKSGTNRKIYINGIKISDNNLDYGYNILWNSNYYARGVCRVGTTYSSGILYHPTNGTIDDVGIWNRELSELEISTLYNNGEGANPFTAEPSLNISEARTIIEDTFNTNLTNPTIEYNQSLYIEYQNSTIREQVFDYFISYNNKRYAINYGNTSYNNIESIRTTLNILQITPTSEESLITQLTTLIDNSLN